MRRVVQVRLAAAAAVLVFAVLAATCSSETSVPPDPPRASDEVPAVGTHPPGRAPRRRAASTDDVPTDTASRPVVRGADAAPGEPSSRAANAPAPSTAVRVVV